MNYFQKNYSIFFLLTHLIYIQTANISSTKNISFLSKFTNYNQVHTFHLHRVLSSFFLSLAKISMNQIGSGSFYGLQGFNSPLTVHFCSSSLKHHNWNFRLNLKIKAKTWMTGCGKNWVLELRSIWKMLAAKSRPLRFEANVVLQTCEDP